MLEHNDPVYPEPFLPAAEHEQVRAEIRAQGFIPDPWLARPERPVFGLNVAFAWPLPAALRAAYDELYARLAALDPAAYVYPFAQTHVTVATLVSFKEHPEPTAAERSRLLGLVPGIARALDGACTGVAPFEVEIGPPVLVRAAAFLPILDPGGAVRRVRQALAERLRDTDPDLAAMRLPQAVHSTVVRFHEAPADTAGFCARFLEIAETTRFGTAPIDEMSVTTETQPYMRGGEIVARTGLR
jgi:hypothetical protein